MLRRLSLLLAVALVAAAGASTANATFTTPPHFIASGRGGLIWSGSPLGAATVTLGTQVVTCTAWSIGSPRTGPIGGYSDQGFLPLSGPCSTVVAGTPRTVRIDFATNCEWDLGLVSVVQNATYDSTTGLTTDMMVWTCAATYTVVGTTCVITAPATFAGTGISMQDRSANDTANANPPTVAATGSRLRFSNVPFPFTSAGCAGVVPASGTETVTASWQIGPTATAAANAFWVEP